jgi:hypothetical protein
MGGLRSAYSVMVGKPGGKRRLGRPKRRRKDETRMIYENRVESCGLNIFL